MEIRAGVKPQSGRPAAARLLHPARSRVWSCVLDRHVYTPLVVEPLHDVYFATPRPALGGRRLRQHPERGPHPLRPGELGANLDAAPRPPAGEPSRVYPAASVREARRGLLARREHEVAEAVEVAVVAAVPLQLIATGEAVVGMRNAPARGVWWRASGAVKVVFPGETPVSEGRKAGKGTEEEPGGEHCGGEGAAGPGG